MMAEAKAKRTLGMRVLDGIEWAGNKLPDPVTLFALAILTVIGLSVYYASIGLSVIHPGTGKEVAAVSLLDVEQVRRLFIDMTKVFAEFPPLGLVLVMMIGVGVAERAGLIGAALRGVVRATPKSLLTGAIVFAGVNSSLAADAGYVVLVPLAAAIYAASGRHPLAGLAAAFAGVAGGFSANLLVTPLDPLLAGLTQAAAQIVDPAREVKATANYFMMIALVPLFTIVGWWVTDRIVEPRLNGHTPWQMPGGGHTHELSDLEKKRERRGLFWAGLVALILIGGFTWLSSGPGMPFRGDDGSIEPLLRSLVAILFVSFLLCGIAYGIGAATIRSDKDAVKMMNGALGDMGGYIVLAFFAAIFIALFNWSNLGVIMSVNGAEWLKGMGFVGLPLLVAIIFVSASINIFIGSASAKWAILAPVLVPMLMQLGISPEWTQAAYRLGDSMTNPITPLLAYFPLILITAQRYVPNAGIGSMVALMLPYSIWFGISSTALFVVWWMAGIPLGPEALVAAAPAAGP
jgi:aminobenzoyl-glutamate transport protein